MYKAILGLIFTTALLGAASNEIDCSKLYGELAASYLDLIKGETKQIRVDSIVPQKTIIASAKKTDYGVNSFAFYMRVSGEEEAFRIFSQIVDSVAKVKKRSLSTRARELFEKPFFDSPGSPLEATLDSFVAEHILRLPSEEGPEILIFNFHRGRSVPGDWESSVIKALQEHHGMQLPE